MSEKKDWVGGRASVFKTLGASNHTDHERAWGDYYATEPKATEWLLKLEKFDGPILEPACGEGHISKVLIRGGAKRHFARHHRQRLWRGGRLSGHRQPGMEREHRYQSAIRLCSGVCGEGAADYPRREKGVYVFEANLFGGEAEEAPFQDPATCKGVGEFVETVMCHEW